ncbi:MAG: TonB-dependent receptor [Pseudomonadota bacterium]
MKLKRITQITAVLFGSVGAAGLPLVAFAQVATAVQPAAEKPQGSPAAAADAQTQVIVTGSRVAAGSSSPVPLTVISQEKLQDLRPTTIADSLNTLPVFSGSRGQTSNPTATGGTGGGNGVANQLNLRNVGPTRNLILLDGRRVPPTSIGNIVDTDMIPQMLVKRVDVVTGGVSAVYGSDAITGVVNFITDTNYTGFKAHAQTGLSTYGDAAVNNTGIAVGKDFADGRGHFVASYEYRDDQGVLKRSERPWFHQPVVAGAGTTASPYLLVDNARLPNSPFGGRINCGATCALNGQYFATNGTLSPFANGQPVVINGATIAGVQVGGAGGYLDNNLKAPLESHQFFGRMDYDLTDNLSAFALISGNIKTNLLYQDPLTINNVLLSSNNAFLAPQYRSQLTAAGINTFRISRLVDQPTDFNPDAGTRFNPVAKSNQYMFTGGLKGKLGDGYDWNVAYTRGQSTLQTTLRNNVNQQRLAAATDAVVNPATGQIVCAAAISNPGAYSNCLPIDLFGPSASSAGSLDYILNDTRYQAVTYLDDIVADISGSPFSNWAGPVTFALSGEARLQSFKSTSEARPNQFANCAGLRPENCIQGSTLEWRQTFAPVSKIKQSVLEAAIETEVPLLKNVAFAKMLSVSGAARYTKYDTVGSYWTGKLGTSWVMSDELRFRGTVSRDIRAPTLNDLNQPASIVVTPTSDRLTGTTATVQQISFGNPDLTAEIGQTFTVGLAWKPSYIRGFTATVDYYNINIKNAIVSTVGFGDVFQNACYDSGGSSPYCALQVRPGGFTRTPADMAASNAATAWYVTPVNIGQIKTAGIDLELGYAGKVFGKSINLRGLAAYQPHILYIQPALETVDQGGVAFGSAGISAAPTVRLTGMASVQLTEQFRIDIQQRWRNAMKLGASGVWSDNHVRSYGQTALNLSYTMPDKRFGNAEFFLNIQNLLNTDPPLASASGTVSFPGQFNGFALTDDPIGRFFTAGVRVKF